MWARIFISPARALTPTRRRRRSSLAPLVIAAAAAALALVPARAGTVYLLDVPPRLQYDEAGGYCGELSLQQLMLPFGAWLPQQYARDAGDGELLLGVNYKQAMDAMKIKYTTWAGSGGYSAFIAWAKKQLMVNPRSGVVTVVYIKGLPDRQYDHIMPIVGVDTSSPPTSYVYAAADVFFTNSGYSTTVIKRTASDWSCPYRTKKDGMATAGCVPSGTQWGHSITGAKYTGIGPAIALSRLSRADEPGPPGAQGVSMGATLKVTGLKVGGSYKVYKITDVARVPSGPTAVGTLSAGDLLMNFTATAAEWNKAVTFASDVPAWFIATVAS